MDEARYFATLFVANRFGLVDLNEIMHQAGERMARYPDPAPWLFDISFKGHAAALFPLIDQYDTIVFAQAFWLAKEAWTAGMLDDAQFQRCCRVLSDICAGEEPWTLFLMHINDEIDLIHLGIFARSATVNTLREQIDALLEEVGYEPWENWFDLIHTDPMKLPSSAVSASAANYVI